VSLAQIRYFVAVAEQGHVGRAAEKLHVAQPPLSRQIQALEAEIGTPLFRRTPRGMHLLPSGEAFLDRARHILNAVDEATAAARAAGPGQAPRTRRSAAE
jgi:DNA-binding transcriptional LysR family regulator